MNERRAIALWVWERMVGEPYKWAGDDPMEGWDCSGAVIEGLRSAGILPRAGDWTAAHLAELFAMLRVTDSRPGCLVFWGTPPTHVEIVWRVWYEGPQQHVYTIGASGGGSAITTIGAASRANAYVKIRPLRGGWTHFVDPFTEVVGGTPVET